MDVLARKPAASVAAADPGKVVLRPFRWADVPRYIWWAYEKEVRIYFSPLLSAEDPRWLINLWLKPATDIMGIWAPIGRNGAYVHVGGIGFQDIDRENRRAEFGFVIGREQWRNRGYGTLALEMLLSHAFIHLGLQSVYARVVPQNGRSLRVLQKLGFKVSGSKPVVFGKETVEVQELTLLATEWLAGRDEDSSERHAEAA